jgi:hypothetical protein
MALKTLNTRARPRIPHSRTLNTTFEDLEYHTLEHLQYNSIPLNTFSTIPCPAWWSFTCSRPWTAAHLHSAPSEFATDFLFSFFVFFLCTRKLSDTNYVAFMIAREWTVLLMCCWCVADVFGNWWIHDTRGKNPRMNTVKRCVCVSWVEMRCWRKVSGFSV